MALILEPSPRNTAPVAAIAAQFITGLDPDGYILLLPADHHIEDTGEFWRCIKKGIGEDYADTILTLGINPTGPETGYGYIRAGEKIGDMVHHVDSFAEKPDLKTAKDYLKSGQYFWNAGIFLCKASAMLSAFKRHAPDILETASQALIHATKSGTHISLEPEHFARCRAQSVDIAILEKSDKVAVISPVNIGWNDIGSWAAISEMRAKASAQNGDSIALDCKDTYIRSDGPMVGAIGLENMIVIVHEGAILIAPKARAQEVKNIVAKLKADKRTDLL